MPISCTLNCTSCHKAVLGHYCSNSNVSCGRFPNPSIFLSASSEISFLPFSSSITASSVFVLRLQWATFAFSALTFCRADGSSVSLLTFCSGHSRVPYVCSRLVGVLPAMACSGATCSALAGASLSDGLSSCVAASFFVGCFVAAGWLIAASSFAASWLQVRRTCWSCNQVYTTLPYCRSLKKYNSNNATVNANKMQVLSTNICIISDHLFILFPLSS